MNTIEPMTPELVDQATATLTRAFDADPRHVPEPHWYVLVVAVDPTLQGRGLGSALVEEGLARADHSNSPCYLETSEERNVRFYERYGLTVITKVALGRGGPPAWAMRREPRRVT